MLPGAFLLPSTFCLLPSSVTIRPVARGHLREERVGFYENQSSFVGKPVRDWAEDAPVRDPQGAAYRLSLQYDEAEGGATLADKLGQFLADPLAGGVEALVIGAWEQVGAGESSA